MTAITFDTHKFIKRLKDTGMPEMQAEEVVELVKEVREEAHGALATKADLTHGLEMLKKELIISVGTMIIALGGFLVAVKYFGHG